MTVPLVSLAEQVNVAVLHHSVAPQSVSKWHPAGAVPQAPVVALQLPERQTATGAASLDVHVPSPSA
jgi:hypothetical protein